MALIPPQPRQPPVLLLNPLGLVVHHHQHLQQALPPHVGEPLIGELAVTQQVGYQPIVCTTSIASTSWLIFFSTASLFSFGTVSSSRGSKESRKVLVNAFQ